MTKTTLRLFVIPSKNCIELLTYLVDHITDVNSMGVKIKVTKLGGSVGKEKTSKICKAAGIKRLPALLTPDKTLIVGKDKIIELINSNINRQKIPDADIGTNEDMADFWNRELYSGTNIDPNGKIARTDDEEETDDIGDINKKMSEYRTRQPKHRGMPMGDEDDDDNGNDNGRAGGGHRDDPGDNIAPPEGKQRVAPGNRKGAMTPDAMDAMMLAAFMDNTVGNSEV